MGLIFRTVLIGLALALVPILLPLQLLAAPLILVFSGMRDCPFAEI